MKAKNQDQTPYQKEVVRRNCASFQTFTLGGVLITGLILLVGFVLSRQVVFVPEYLFFFVYMSFLHFLARRCIRLQPPFIAAVYYLGLAPIYAGGILMGTFLDPERPAITIMVMLTGLTLFIIDKPWRLISYMGVVALAFIVCAYLAKPVSVFTTDTINLLMYWCIAVVINYYALRDRLENVNNYLLVREKSQQDSMTGLLNRTAGERQVQDYLTAGSTGAFIILDIDNFKTINDTFGHQVGDQVICGVGEALRSLFRPTDVIWRLGGDEFAVFAPELYHANLCQQKFDVLLNKLSKIETGIPDCHAVTISAGCTIFSGPGLSFSQLYRSTDNALYTAKRDKKGSFVLCEL